MMDKVKINTQIVQMRKHVKQAKIHVISKCVKQARLLQNRNGGAENQILKCQRKAERLLAEIVILKKIKPDTVSKMALTKAEDWKTVLAQKNVSLEDRCFAMLANFDAVQKEVDKFYNTNGEVLSEVTTLIERLGSTTKRKRLYQNKKNNTGQASSINKSVEEYKQDIQKDEQDLNASKRFKSGNVEDECKEQLNNLNLTKSDAESDNEELMEDEADESNTNQYENTENKLFTKINPKDGSKSFNNTKERNSSEKIEDKKNEELQSSSELSGLDQDSKLGAEVEHKGTKRGENSLNFKNAHLQNNMELSYMDKDAEMSETKNKMQKQTLDIENAEQQSNSELSYMDQDSELGYKGKNVTHKQRLKNTANSYVQSNSELSNIDSTTSKTISKSLDIQSRLLAMANYPSAKPANHKANSLSVKKSQANLKAIAVLNLDELQDLAEIPIQSPKAKAENMQESKKHKEDSCLNTDDEKDSSEGENDTDGSNEDSFERKKDPFFLTEGAVSDSDREGDPPSFNEKKFGRFDRQNSNTEFSNRRFQRDSHYGPSFSKNSFQKDNFKDKNMAFKGERHPGSGFNKSKKFAPTERKRFDDRLNFNKHGKGDFPTKHFEPNSYNKHQEKAIFQKNQTKKFQKGTPDDKPLHPSWEAKKKMKEAQNTKFQGKRIVFD